MAALTADEIEYIRAFSGDDCVEYEVSDVLLQKLHDRAETTVCGCSDPLDVDVVLVLRIRVAKAAKLFTETTVDGVNKAVSQKFDHLKALLAEWEARCGMAGGVIGTGVLDQQLDTFRTGSEYAAYPWEWL